jgi:hypothetical protein
MAAAPINRRDFLHRAAILGTALPLVRPRQAYAQKADLKADLVARRVFFDNPDYINVRVSPDGQHRAYVAPVDRVNNLWVISRSAMSQATGSSPSRRCCAGITRCAA